MNNSQYETFKRLRNEDIRLQHQKARAEADKAYNQGLWDSCKWRNPLAYFILKRA